MASPANKMSTILNKLKKSKSEKKNKATNIFHFFYYNCIKSTNGSKTRKCNCKSYPKIQKVDAKLYLF